ncbi:NADH dehydrogenase [ubiquinone] 1 alpha subcomplex subunit 9, mitochondrial [Halotydeus destructor]|nr:NADH dehydrogenase [ubiquinone] 1 alpha subcomplex subunit 9, mitochondrial [Halotydeus destructor]
MIQVLAIKRVSASATRTIVASRSFSDEVSRNDDIKSTIPYIKNNSFPSPAAVTLKRGTGGRSSFNGTVCTVFGAGGLVGRAVVNRLGKVGTQIVVPYRGDPSAVQNLKLCGDLGQIVFLPFYLRDDDSIYRALKYSNVVINLIGKENETPSFSFNDVHVDGARRIARIAKEAGVQRYIQVSSISASPNPTPKVMRAGSGFLKSKYEGELAVREEFPESTIFRPSDIYGEDDRYFVYWNNIMRRSYKRILLWNKGRGVFKQPLFASDLAEGIVNSIFDNSSPGQTYDAVGPRRYELIDLVDYMNRLVSRAEEDNFSIQDMRWAPNFWIRVYMLGALRKYPPVCWEKIEKENVSDELTPGNPTLEDLGVKLTYFEQMAPFYLKMFNRTGYYEAAYGEIPPPTPPKYVV